MLIDDENAMRAFGKWLSRALRPGDVVALSGELGAGKTTLARAVINGLGYDGDVPSPSFPLVIPYHPPDVSLPLWHVDLYRIESADEIEALALNDALYDGALMIEWPERLAGGQWIGALDLRLDMVSNTARRLTAQVPTSWRTRWPFQ